MRDHSIFEGIKELRGVFGTYRIDDGKIFKQNDEGNYVFYGRIGNGYKRISNKKIYEIVSNW